MESVSGLRRFLAYSSLKQINKSNATKLDVAWIYPTGPVVDGVMYVLVQNNSVVALDAATGPIPRPAP